jgi:hypothetical protein
LAGAGLAIGAPPPGAGTGKADELEAGEGTPAEGGVVIARDAVGAPGSTTLGLSSIRGIRPQNNEQVTERFGHFLLT